MSSSKKTAKPGKGSAPKKRKSSAPHNPAKNTTPEIQQLGIKEAAKLKQVEREEKWNLIEQYLLEEHGHIFKAVRKAGVSYKAHIHWMSKYSEYKERIQAAEEYLIYNAAQTVFTMGDDENLEAAKFILSRKARHLGWGDKAEITIGMEKEILEWLERVRK